MAKKGNGIEPLTSHKKITFDPTNIARFRLGAIILS